MKYNINVIKSVWRRLPKPSRATLDAISSEDAVYTEVFSETDIFCERWKHLVNPEAFPERLLWRPLETPTKTSWMAMGMVRPRQQSAVNN
jgi:hypothetical protein